METTKEKHATHTPGPWVIIPERNGVNIQGKETNHLIAHMTMASVPDERLIASAPDLLEQCKLFEKCLTYYHGTNENTAISALANENRDKLRELLAKVDGREG